MKTKTMSVGAIPLCAALATLPASLFAQDTPVDLGTFILSAAGIEVDPLTAPASVSVVTSEQLEKAGITDLTDALREVPGLSVAGAADGENIFIRGLPSEYTLILVDGKRQSTRESRTNAAGGVDQYYIPPISAIERIEVVRGPMSSLHGSDAMGGVINVITKPVAPQWGGSVTVESTFPQNGEDAGQQQASFYLNGPLAGESLGLQIWGRRLAREGSDRTRGPGERDLTDLKGRLSWTPAEGHTLSLELGETEMDTDPRLNTRHSAALGYEGQIAGWDTTASLAFERAGRVTDGSDRKPVIENTVLDAKASRGFDLAGQHEVTFGLQHLNAKLTDQNPGTGSDDHDQFSNSQSAAFAEDIWTLSPDFTLTLGGRLTQDERFGAKLTPRAYGLWKLRDGLFVSGGVSTGYRTPELRQSVEGYYLTTNRGSAVIAGTQDLRPEESTSFEFGLRYEGANAHVGATAFHTDFSDKIESRDTGTTTVIGSTTYDLYEYYNVGKAEVRGIEVAAGGYLTPSLELSGSYTYTTSKRLTGDLAGQPLTRTPKHQASLRLDWQTPVAGLNIWGAGRYFGDNVSVSSTSRGSSVTQYDGYATWDIGASYPLSDTVTLKAAIYNLGDTDINHDDHGTVLNGRTAWVAVTAEF